MGRAGAGGGGHGHHSSGGHNMNLRSSGGHHIGSSHGCFRPGSSRSSDHERRSSYRSQYFDSNLYHGNRIWRLNNQVQPWTAIVASVLFAICVLAALFLDASDVPKSTVQRVIIKNPVGFENDCVIDELSWINNRSQTEKNLQYFYQRTGIQPFVYLKKYDPELVTDDDKIAYANNFYETNIDDEYTFLVVYFAEKDADNDVGFMSHVAGKSITTVMDAEAVDIFWSYWDKNWYSDQSTDDVIVSSFESTAKRIMQKTRGIPDVMYVVCIFAIVVAVISGIVVFVKLRYQRERERAQETQDILNTPLEHIKSDDLRDKYL